MNRAEFCRYQEETFDAFCKRIIHNTSIDEKKKAETRECRESSLFECSEWELAASPIELRPEAYTCDFLAYGIIVLVKIKLLLLYRYLLLQQLYIFVLVFYHLL